MTARDGYHWFLPGWHTLYWWDTDHFNKVTQNPGYTMKENIPCTTAQMDIAIEGHMTLRNAFFGPENSHIVGNMTVKEWNRTYTALVRKLVSCDIFHIFIIMLCIKLLSL